jgi:SAM-dependent methyltransferase
VLGALDPQGDERASPVSDREAIAEKAQSFFEEIWSHGDYWQLESSELNQTSFARQRALLEDRRYGRVLEIGCGAGLFTRRLAEISDYVLGIDVASAAIAQARATGLDPDAVEFRVTNVMDYDPGSEGPWDLVVLSETIYYLGWLYSMFDVCWLASMIYDATTEGGRMLMANTYGVGDKDYILLPWLIDTYHDLLVNVGYRREAEEVVHGVKHTVDYEILITLYSKPPKS